MAEDVRLLLLCLWTPKLLGASSIIQLMGESDDFSESQLCVISR
jgi:hypothetical protein